MEISLIFLFAAGALGSLAKDILEDNSIKLPKKIDSDFSLGFLGGMIVGGITGYLVDGSLKTAFMAGYAGTGIAGALIAKKNAVSTPANGTTEAVIRKIAQEEGVDPDLAVRVAKCESGLNWKAENVNKDGSRDRGLFQINEKWHPEVSDEMAFNPITATQFFCKAFKGGNIGWWNQTKSCWEKGLDKASEFAKIK